MTTSPSAPPKTIIARQDPYRSGSSARGRPGPLAGVLPRHPRLSRRTSERSVRSNRRRSRSNVSFPARRGSRRIAKALEDGRAVSRRHPQCGPDPIWPAPSSGWSIMAGRSRHGRPRRQRGLLPQRSGWQRPGDLRRPATRSMAVSGRLGADGERTRSISNHCSGPSPAGRARDGSMPVTSDIGHVHLQVSDSSSCRTLLRGDPWVRRDPAELRRRALRLGRRLSPPRRD